MPVPILMYHAIGDGPTGTQEFDDADFTVTETQFRAQLSYLRDQGFTTLRLSELVDRMDDAQKQVVISFDDGHASDVGQALPMLREFGFVAEFFITTAWLGKSGYMSPEQIALLAKEGMGVGSHGHTHDFFASMDEQQAADELATSMSHLESILGSPVESFSLPGGQPARNPGALIQQFNIRYLCNSVEALCDKESFPHAIPRVAIRKDTSLEDFAAIVNGEPEIYQRMQRRTARIALLRRTLGNRLYMVLRELAFKFR